MSKYFVYIMASKSRVLYVGLTNDLVRRVWQHQHDHVRGFVSSYNVHRLVYYECFQYVGNAIAREKQIKGWLRRKKIALIGPLNPTWEDLSERWFKAQKLTYDPEQRNECASPPCTHVEAEPETRSFQTMSPIAGSKNESS